MKILKLFCLILFSCSLNAGNIEKDTKKTPFPSFNNEEYELIHQFYSQDRKPLGKVYVKYITDEIFNSMVIKKEIKGKEKVLYFIDFAQLISVDGVDIEVYKEDFYGYKVILIKNDYIVINYLRNEGKSVSDDITLEWNYASEKFQVMKTP